MVQRVWRGWTTAADAAACEQLLREQVFPGIAAKGVATHHGIALLRRPLESGEGDATRPAEMEHF